MGSVEPYEGWTSADAYFLFIGAQGAKKKSATDRSTRDSGWLDIEQDFSRWRRHLERRGYPNENWQCVGASNSRNERPDKEKVTDYIRCAAREAKARDLLYLRIYYTGHADSDGEWSLKNGTFSIADMEELMNEIQFFGVLQLFMDTCHGNQWTRKHNEWACPCGWSVVSAAGSRRCASDNHFSKFMFTKNPYYSWYSAESYLEEQGAAFNESGEMDVWTIGSWETYGWLY